MTLYDDTTACRYCEGNGVYVYMMGWPVLLKTVLAEFGLDGGIALLHIFRSLTLIKLDYGLLTAIMRLAKRETRCSSRSRNKQQNRK